MLENENQNMEELKGAKATLEITAEAFNAESAEANGLTVSNANAALDDSVIRTVYVASFVQKVAESFTLFDAFMSATGNSETVSSAAMGFTSLK